jgi:hypothetical protein
MSIAKKLAHKAEAVKGSVKRNPRSAHRSTGACAPKAAMTGSRAT